MFRCIWSGPLVLTGVFLIGLAGCNGSSRSADNGVEQTESTSGSAAADSAAVPVPSQQVKDADEDIASPDPLSCADDIGSAAAESKVKLCRNVSPATHPPCNVANSCAMIDDEIARSCALFDGKGTPMPACQPAPKSMAAAVAVVQRYYAAINAHDYGTAWQQWGENGPPNQPLEKFANGFAKTQSTRVTIGALEPGSGGAGSIYQTIPVTVDATLTDGAKQRFVGKYILRRVNGVDGASPAQLRWHIGSAHLEPAAGGRVGA